MATLTSTNLEVHAAALAAGRAEAARAVAHARERGATYDEFTNAAQRE